MIFRNKHLVRLIILTVFSCILHFGYYFHAPGIIIDADSYGYYEVGTDMWKNRLFIHDSRTPIYPIIVVFFMLLKGNFSVPIFSQGFNESVFLLYIFQTFLSILGIITLFLSLNQMKFNKQASFAYSLFIASNILLFSWNRHIMTEAIGIFWLISLTFLFVMILQKPTWLSFLLLFLSFCFGFLLRPIYCALPLIILPIIIYYNRTWKIIFMSLAVSLGFLTLILFYIQQNKSNYHYEGLSQVVDWNFLGIILKFNLSIDAGINQKIIYSTVSDFRKTGKPTDPYVLIDEYSDIYRNRIETKNELKQFTTAVILANLPEYISKSFRILPKALMEVRSDLILLPPNTSLLAFFYQVLFHIYSKIQFITLIILVAYPVVFIRFLKKPNFGNCIMMFLGTISSYQIIFSVFFGYIEYSRLICIAQPQMYLFCFYFIWQIIVWLRRKTQYKLFLS